MSDRNYLEEAMPCPKCGNPNCVLEVKVNQERENTCPECGTVFTDAHEQFGPQVYYGLYYEGAEETDPPVAMFDTKERAQAYIKFLGESPDEDDQIDARRLIVMETTVYGAYWNSSEENPYGENPIPFTPESLPRQPNDADYWQHVTTANMTPLEIKMRREFAVGSWPVYFCENNQRWYMFVRLADDCVEAVSINNGPVEFVKAHMSGVKGAMMMTAHKTGKKGWVNALTWEQFIASDGAIDVPVLPEHRYEG